MDRENFKAIIDRYLEKFERTNSAPDKEYFKWEAIQTFKNHWNLDAPDMLSMFSAATKKLSVLIDTGKAAPTSGIKELLKIPEEIELVRTAFRDLYADDKGDLSLRQKKLDQFISTINHRIEHYWPGSYLYPQTMRSAICYLTMEHPNDNYIFFWSRANNWANCVEFGEDIGSGNHFSLATYYRMCDELREEIVKHENLISCAEKRAKAAGSTIDDNYHTMVYDIIFCATAYNLYVDIPHYPKGTPARVKRAKERTELEKTREEYLAAKNKYNKLLKDHPPVFDLTGHEVKSKAFGVGTVLKHLKNKETVKFQSGVKNYIYPDAYNQKHLVPVLPEDQNAFAAALTYDKDVAAANNILSAKEKEFAEKTVAFEKNWKKTAKADIDTSEL